MSTAHIALGCGRFLLRDCHFLYTLGIAEICLFRMGQADDVLTKFEPKSKRLYALFTFYCLLLSLIFGVLQLGQRGKGVLSLPFPGNILAKSFKFHTFFPWKRVDPDRQLLGNQLA